MTKLRRARTRRRLSPVLGGTALLALALAACSSGSSGGSGSSGPIHIGGLLGLSGVAASYGQQIQAGENLAVSQVNAGGGIHGRQVVLTEKNTNYTPSQAVAAFRELAADKSNLAILGPNDSTDAAATTPLANQNSIVSLVQGAAAAWPVPFGKDVFLLPAGNTEVINDAVKAAVKNNPAIKSAAIIYASDESYAVSAVNEFKSAAKANGITIKTVQNFASTQQNFSAQLTSIKDAGVQAVLVSAVAANLGPMLVQAHQLGLTGVQWVGDAGATDPAWAPTAGASGNGLITALPFMPTLQTSNVKAFVTAFKAKYKSMPTLYNAYGYDAAGSLLQAMKDVTGGLTRQAVQESLAKITYSGVTGTFGFPTGSGNSSRQALTIVQMKDGAFVPLS